MSSPKLLDMSSIIVPSRERKYHNKFMAKLVCLHHLAINQFNKRSVLMNIKILLFLPLIAIVFSCATGQQGQQSVVRTVPTSLVFESPRAELDGLPSMQDLPIPASIKTSSKKSPYKGIIKNKTRYEVSVASQNSDATLLIPPHGWIEYTTWKRRSDVTAYHDGKPFYCLKLSAHPNKYPFMCSNYDFMAEIDKPEPVVKPEPKKKKKRVAKKQPKC
jgi:hypothetical protein